MKTSDLAALFALAAIWGASFLFMRITAPAFGPFAMVALRVGLAALFLLPILAWRGGLGLMWQRRRALLVVGAFNSAIPFTFYAWAMLSVQAGFASITNATAPLFAALIAWLWLKDRLSLAGVAGLLIGMGGVIILVWPKIRFDEGGLGWPVLACLAATLSYGFAANYTKRNLAGVDSLVTATGSQACAALLVVPLAWWQWPTVNPSVEVWAAAAVLAIGCTGIAYILFFRLIANIGPARAIAVTFLIPAFGMLWGGLFLDETVTLNMLGGGAVILLGIGITNGLIRWPVGRGGAEERA